MALLRALRISMNGRPGEIFEAEGKRVQQLTAGENPIAEAVTPEQLSAEVEKAEAEKAKADEHDPDIDGPDETKPATKPKNKGGKKPADAGKAAEVK
jgi:hypothetical protein